MTIHTPTIQAAGTAPLPTAVDSTVDIARLAAMPPLEYETARTKEADRLGWRVSVLDTEVKKLQVVDSADSHVLFPTVDPYAEAISPTLVLDEISTIIKKYIVLDQEQADAAALWVAQTWFISHIDLAALAIINAPEKACGKTQLLTIMGYMSCNPLPASNASPSALFRSVEKWLPTLLVDEADTFFKDNPELQGMVNAGYLHGGYVLRSEAVGNSFEPRMFSVFSAKAIAGIALEKHLPDATMSRGIIFNLRRKMPHESVSRLRHADRHLFSEVVSKLARFAQDYAQQVKYARPLLPESLSDRDQDNWEPLLAIAGCAGESWIKRATEAALKLSDQGEKSVSIGNQLLADIQVVFETKGINKIRSVELINYLGEDNRGKPISPRHLSKQLSTYGISSKTIRFSTHDTPKGYELSQFEDAFARYLKAPEDLTQQGNSKPVANNGEPEGVADILQQGLDSLQSATTKTKPDVDPASDADDIF
jgi:hypothetical protein